MTDAELMNSIKEKWGTQIETACHSSSVPQAFLAALIANESSGKPTATRYEPTVFYRLEKKYPEWTQERLTANATSWGLTQILGENYPGDPHELLEPSISLPFSVQMLAGFAQRFELSLEKDFEELFRCWNTGQPNRLTYDPNYVTHGLKRIEIYDSL